MQEGKITRVMINMIKCLTISHVVFPPISRYVCKVIHEGKRLTYLQNKHGGWSIQHGNTIPPKICQCHLTNAELKTNTRYECHYKSRTVTVITTTALRRYPVTRWTPCLCVGIYQANPSSPLHKHKPTITRGTRHRLP